MNEHIWLEPLEINDLENGVMALYAKLLATAFAIPIEMLSTEGTYVYYQALLDEANKQQSPWGRVMFDIAVNELTKEEEE